MPRVDHETAQKLVKLELYTGELPRTRFLDMQDSVKVDLINVSKPNNAMNEMVKAAESAQLPTADFDPRVQSTLEGKGIWMMEEIPQLIFRVSGVSRIFTHQMVRQRIGITFMQQGTGDTDCRHHDVIVPGCVGSDPKAWEIFKSGCLHAKLCYAHLLDDRGLTTRSARYVLPASLGTFIYFQVSLAALKNIYAKRICTMTQTWETYLFAVRLREAVLAACPDWRMMFESPCEQGKCWFHKVKDEGIALLMCEPDLVHDTYDWNPKDFIKHGTPCEIESPMLKSSVLPQSYIGWEEQTNGDIH